MAEASSTIVRIVNELSEEFSLSEEFTNDFIAECFLAIKTFDSKQHDYGSENIGMGLRAFGDASILIRMNDKMQRLINLISSGKEAANESIDDSLQDIAVYALMLRISRSGKWPTAPDYINPVFKVN